ncbi:MAG: biopolymer transporter ExbD [Lentisphaeraceae bacterium]|nr:biopolymer transporter ExbD [Lentisphaeraceae bacterium]
MARKKKGRKEEKADVPIASMIDVVFLLLVYFIVTMKPTLDQAWVAVNLPGPTPPTVSEEIPPPPIDVFVHSGEYMYRNNSLNLAELETELRNVHAMHGGDDDVAINIKVSLKARHAKLISLLDLLSKVGLQNFNLHSLKQETSR